MSVIGNKKVIRAWTMYDWANSVYNLVITSAIFPIYYNQVTRVNGNDVVTFFGFELLNTTLFSYALACAFLMVAATAPLLSGIADYTGKKKSFMGAFVIIGSFSCISMFWFEGHNIYLGVFSLIFATYGYAGSLVFYNAFLPEIAPPEDHDKISARGFSMGYIGSVILLVISLIIIEKPEWFGLKNDTFPARLSFLLTGIWWFGFALIPLIILPNGEFIGGDRKHVLVKGYNELRKVWRELKKQWNLKTFLTAFFFYIMATQTVMFMAASFAEKEIKISTSGLIMTILIIQIVGIIGAHTFAYLSKRFGNIRALMIAVTMWIIICFFCFYIYTAIEFYIVAFFVGLVMGGIQALSRSTYSKMLPETQDHASYFSFYDVSEKLAIVGGLFLFGSLGELTGSMRNSIFSLIVAFVIGLVFLVLLNKTLSSSSKSHNSAMD